MADQQQVARLDRSSTRAAARVAAWPHYWRRAGLSRKVGQTSRWPVALTWTDEDCTAVERFLVSIEAPDADPFAIELPDVLRG